MSSGKTHDYHILPPSPWPLVVATGLMVMFGCAVMWWHDYAWGKWASFAGALIILTGLFFWFGAVRNEANSGDHTPVVQLHHRYGMILFIVSEVMFFVAWFWAFFRSSIFPSTAESVGGVWPPQSIEILDPFAFPLLNTLVLLLSGTTITWAHHALINNDRKGLKQGLWLTVILGVLFMMLQAYEYHHAAFGLAGNIYGATFYMATGFHGFHIMIGTVFLAVCLWRAYQGDFTPKQHFGFEGAAWYWHFVDVVWLFLFLAIYVWGSNFGAAVGAVS